MAGTVIGRKGVGQRGVRGCEGVATGMAHTKDRYYMYVEHIWLLA